MVEQTNFTKKEFFIVGIGASAGGVQALESFFANVPDDPNAAFVVVQHLSPKHKSMMSEILQRQTPMTVQEAQDQTLLEPGNVYVLPSRKSLVIQERQLRLSEKSDSFDYPINRFFSSLISGWGERIIAILLSGTGKDGTEGLQAVSRAGGIALVQSPETAQFTSMPTNAIPSGLVDEVLSPEDLAKTVFELIRFSENFPESTAEDASTIDPKQLEEILDILAETEDIDFSHYKVSTLSRRIHHRCALTRQSNLDHYIRLLKHSPEEQKKLRQDLLIGATAFFRDQPAWELLENEILPKLISNLEDNQQLRIWVSACATGEEAYSMAILVDEALSKTDKPIQAKIFATDLDSNALEIAAHGVYPEHIASNISPARLERYFNQENGQYQVKRSLREMLIIAPHDLTKNAGFSRMNLVSCRNVLIYMQPQLQKQVLKLLHFALAPHGVLFLGSSETLGSLQPEFDTLQPKWKLFQKQRNANLSSLPLTPQRIVAPFTTSSRNKPRQDQTNRIIKEVFKYCFAERQITCLLVNQDNRLLRVFYNAAQLLEFPVGEAVLDITEIIHPTLRLPLSTALHRAKRDQETVLYSGIKIERNQQTLLANLRVGLDQSNPATSDPPLIIVIEVETQATAESETMSHVNLNFDANEETAQQITELEYELQQTKENLQVTIEELETTNEEQQATNEELLASNEELQSTNEELQSVNEELYTVNAEYQFKIEELTQLNNDIDNLLRSTKLGVVFLDQDLNIRKFTPAIANTINIKPTDVGRPLADLTNNLDCPNFLETIQSVIKTKRSLEREVTQTASGESLLMRVNPYVSDDDSYNGIVITFVNVNELKRTQRRLQQANATLENLYAASPVGLGLLDEDFKFVRINHTLANMNGASVGEHLGQSLATMLPDLAPKIGPYLTQVLTTGESIDQVEIRGTTPCDPEQERIWLASYYPVDFLEGKRGIGAVIVEVTQRIKTEEALRESEAKLREVQRLAKLGNWEIDVTAFERIEDAVAEWSPELLRMSGFDPQTSLPPMKQLFEHIHPVDRETFRQKFRALATQGTAYKLDLRFYRPDGEMRYFHSLGRALRDQNGRIIKLYGAVMDITERKAIEEELVRQNQALEEAIAIAQTADAANQAKSEFLSNISHEIRTPLNSILGANQLLMRSNISDSQQKLLRRLQTNSERLLILINDILDLSKIESRRLDFEKRPFLLSNVVQTLQENFETPMEQKGLTFTVNIDDKVPDTLIGDDFRLQQVLNNLLSNAIKFTEMGEITLTITNATQDQANDNALSPVMLKFEMQDTGIGIAKADQDNLFQPFTQADSSVTRQYGGTGLGLAICRRIVELMEGNIGVESTPGEGSTFFFTVPLEMATSEQLSETDAPAPSETPANPPSLSDLKVLIVEDYPDNRDLLILMLNTLGCDIDWVENGQQALDKLAQDSFDIVLMDCQMPVLDGYETTRQLRQRDGELSHTIIIGVTANALAEDKDRCLAAGMDDYISKPIMLDQLTELLQYWSDQIQS